MSGWANQIEFAPFFLPKLFKIWYNGNIPFVNYIRKKTDINLSERGLRRTIFFCAAFLAFMTWAVLSSDIFSAFDLSLAKMSADMHGGVLDRFFLAATYFGSMRFAGTAIILLAALALLLREFGYFILFLGTMLGAGTFIGFMKLLTERFRPSAFPSVYAEASYSFPSGHTAMSVVLYGLIAYIVARHTKNRSVRFAAIFACAAAVAIIGYSRIFLGVHYASDVLAGVAAGILWLSIGLSFFERLRR